MNDIFSPSIRFREFEGWIFTSELFYRKSFLDGYSFEKRDKKFNLGSMHSVIMQLLNQNKLLSLFSESTSVKGRRACEAF